MSIDSWKKIESQDRVEKVHQENVAARKEMAREAPRDQKGVLQNAYQKSLGSKDPANKTAVVGDKKLPEGAHKENSEAAKTATPQNTLPNSATRIAQSNVPVVNANPKGAVADPSLKNSIPTNVSSTNAPQNAATSHFVSVVKQPQLVDLLLKKSNTSPKPPQADGEEKKTAGNLQSGSSPAQEFINSKGVPAPLAAGQGTQTDDATGKQNRSEAKKKDKKKETSRGAQGRGRIANHEPRTTNHGSLEAASSGVASDSSEDPWVEFRQANCTINPSSEMDGHCDEVRVRSGWLEKYVLKKSPEEVGQAVEVVGRAVNLDERLNKILKLGRAARKNVNGGMPG